MGYQVADVQTLITQGNLVDVTDINPNIAYVNIGYFQRGQRRSGNASSAYRQFAINLQSIINAAPGTPIAVKDEGLLISNNIISIDFRGANVSTALDPADVTNRSVIVTVIGGGGGGGTVTAVGASNGLIIDPLSPPASPIVKLGTNPLLAATDIPTNVYDLTMSGSGKIGIGFTGVPTVPKGKLQVRGNSLSSKSTFTASVTGATMTVATVLTGTIEIGDYVFPGYNTGTSSTAGIQPGTYIVAQTFGPPGGAGTYTLSSAVNNVPLGSPVYTTELAFKTEDSSQSPRVQIFNNGYIIAGRFVLDSQGGTFTFGYTGATNPFFLRNFGSSGSAFALTLGQQLALPGTASINFNGSGFSSIYGNSNFEINYVTFNSGNRIHKFLGRIMVSQDTTPANPPLGYSFVAEQATITNIPGGYFYAAWLNGRTRISGLPTGTIASPPAGQSGDLWIDTADNSIKILP